MRDKQIFDSAFSRRDFLSVAGMGIVAISLFPKVAFSAQNQITGIRTGTQPGNKTRLVIESKLRPDYSLSYPKGQLVVSIKGKCMAKPIMTEGTIVNNIDIKNGKIIVNLKKDINPIPKSQIMVLSPTGGGKYRLVLDFMAGSTKAKAVAEETTAVAKKTLDHKPVIVIDPGHGGKDPGCIGTTGTREKDIVLSVGKKLYDALDDAGFDVYLTRRRDVFLNLGTRSDIAERKHADLFISVHANSNPKKSIKGLSVYTLSAKASDIEAQKVADAENAADKIEVDGFERFEPEIRNALSSLQQNMVAENSVEFAQQVLGSIKIYGIARTDKARRFAPFAVLKSTIPSCLVELGHLSNKGEELQLRSPDYQNKLVAAIRTAVQKYNFDV